jgi:hypothetical protein
VLISWKRKPATQIDPMTADNLPSGVRNEHQPSTHPKIIMPKQAHADPSKLIHSSLLIPSEKAIIARVDKMAEITIKNAVILSPVFFIFGFLILCRTVGIL